MFKDTHHPLTHGFNGIQECDKDLYDVKILETIDYIKSVSKKKPTKERILKYMARKKFYRC